MSYIQPLLEAHDAHAVPSFLLDFYGRTEASCRRAPIALIDRFSRAC